MILEIETYVDDWGRKRVIISQENSTGVIYWYKNAEGIGGCVASYIENYVEEEI